MVLLFIANLIERYPTAMAVVGGLLFLLILGLPMRHWLRKRREQRIKEAQLQAKMEASTQRKAENEAIHSMRETLERLRGDKTKLEGNPR